MPSVFGRTELSARDRMLAAFEPLRSVPPGETTPLCPFIAASVEIADPEHPARRRAQDYKASVAARFAEAAREITAGTRHWSDVIRVGRPSLPGGILQKWPAHAPATLQTLATLMISISDNTAADTLLTTLGQDKVGEMVRTVGVADPARTVPVLTTMQAFELKSPTHAALAAAWARNTPEQRARLLADNAAAFAATPVDPHMFDGKPLAIDTIEWFGSPRDMAATLNWLRLHGDATTQDILAINPGTSAATAARFAYIGYKGGSEPGVLTLNYLVQTKGGEWLAVTGNWHNADAAVSELGLASLMNRALLLAANQ